MTFHSRRDLIYPEPNNTSSSDNNFEEFELLNRNNDDLIWSVNTADYEFNGSVTVSLEQFGGRFGKDLDTPYDEVIKDDGISNRKPGGLNLKIDQESVVNGSWKVYAKIV